MNIIGVKVWCGQTSGTVVAPVCRSGYETCRNARVHGSIRGPLCKSCWPCSYYATILQMLGLNLATETKGGKQSVRLAAACSAGRSAGLNASQDRKQDPKRAF